MHRQLWIGLVEVRPLAECNLLEGARGAYVHVMGWANTADEFRAAVVKRSTELHLVIIDLRETEPWAIRSSGEDPLRNEFFEMADRANANQKQLVFGRFHAWFEDQPIQPKDSGTTTPSSEKQVHVAGKAPVRPKPGTENGQ